jgi:predicted small lipoprotein YifL
MEPVKTGGMGASAGAVLMSLVVAMLVLAIVFIGGGGVAHPLQSPPAQVATAPTSAISG